MPLKQQYLVASSMVPIPEWSFPVDLSNQISSMRIGGSATESTSSSSFQPNQTPLSSLARYKTRSGFCNTLKPEHSQSMMSPLCNVGITRRIQPSFPRLDSMPLHGPTFHETVPQHSHSRLGMRDVPTWLKTLRLHKYTALFQELTYEQMMTLDDKSLESRGVTKGARRKILQSIEKLVQRPALLRSMEMRLGQPNFRCLNCAISSLRNMVVTPIRPYARKNTGTVKEQWEGSCMTIPSENLSSMICCVVQQIHNHIFGHGIGIGTVIGDVDDEYLLMWLTVYDKILSCEAFSAAQKNRILGLKRIARKAVSPSDLKRQRTAVPSTSRCDWCKKDNSRMDQSFNMTGEPLKGPNGAYDIQKLQKLLMDIDPSVLVVTKENMLQMLGELLQQQQLQQQAALMHQQQQECIKQRIAAQQHQIPMYMQSCARQARQASSNGKINMGNKEKEPELNAMFRPYPLLQSNIYVASQQQSTLSHLPTLSPSSVYPSALSHLPTLPSSPSPSSLYSNSSQPSPVSPVSPPWTYSVYDSKDLRDIYSRPEQGKQETGQQQPQKPVFEVMQDMEIGTWQGVVKEKEQFMKGPFDVVPSHDSSCSSGPFDVFPSHESTSGYSSGSSERGSGAGSPKTEGRDRLMAFPEPLYSGLFHSTNWAFETST